MEQLTSSHKPALRERAGRFVGNVLFNTVLDMTTLAGDVVEYVRKSEKVLLEKQLRKIPWPHQHIEN